ncbi:UDP-N-acetylmuramoyl-L-alanyl-D-glutamate:meso-diaminopimelate ligase [Rubrivivax sp. A210]|uniref:UDP-N-acetylmuramoyl-L-alanyl-D-glutamate--2, 6-diaminopimelate ligase n=1 Tax=Rubrivivax sp. A210 TaxID=2772301 RepID=UPI0019193F09|nr:UDP-N-acetylmuramoyl-L-alanyl-D-glutamate--2,6-diaminopimelate ligase [Rubrivivax sp. A210]CAD5370533.1 UDP-N-acetylmuramoyl-L-alanyl-D-glutamate:meso-diaminopimelate ligase [Rubrivivax sp. A210]
MATQLASAIEAVLWLRGRVKGRLCMDSRAVQPGDGFIAWPGHAVDGRAFVAAALAAGAAACLVEAEGAAAFALGDDERVAILPGLKAASGAIASAWFGEPGRALDVVAITGTNGKTSSAWWVAQALSALGRRGGVIGTLGVGEPPRAGADDGAGAIQPTGLTTPDPLTLHATLRRFADEGYAACAIEASSIGLVEHRLDALAIDVAVFTNFTRDHLDFHGSMEAYWAAKRMLFGWPGLRAAVVNVDDAQGERLAQELAGGALDLWSVSRHGPARLQARALGYDGGGLAFEVSEGGATVALRSALIGDYNASNLLGVLGALRALGLPLAAAAGAMAALSPVPGRLQRVAGREVEVVVDYAHTPDALEKALQALRPLASARGGRLWCVFGCGGNRDATKRPLMGAIAKRDADRVVLTSDNPRQEAPGLILAQILAGVTGHDEVAVIEDRRAAIRSAVVGAAPGDVVLLAGKGHEDYQEVAGVKRPFSDAQEAAAALREREEGAA